MKRKGMFEFFFNPWRMLATLLLLLCVMHPVLAFAADAVVATGSTALQDVAGKVLDFSQISMTGIGGQSVGMFTFLEDAVMPYLVGNLAWLRPILPMAVSFILWLAGGIHDGASWGTILKGTLGTGLGSMLLHNVLDKMGAAPAFLAGLVLQVFTKGSAGKPGAISPDTYKAMLAKGQDVSAWTPDGLLRAGTVIQGVPSEVVLAPAIPQVAPAASGWPAQKGMPQV